MLQRNSSLADQLMHELIIQIVSGQLTGSDGRLPSEAELCQRYAVSRATVREALTKLELAGIVIRRHGVGTFVNRVVQDQPGLISGWLDEAPAFVDLIARAGHRPDCRLIKTELVTAGQVTAPLGLEAEAGVVSIEKLFLADGIPVIHSRTALPCQFIEPANGLPLPEESYRKPVYQLLEEYGQRKVHHQASEVRAVVADTTLAGWLACQPGDPLLRVEEIGYDMEQMALFYALHHFRGDNISFRQIRIPSFTIDTP